MNFKFVLVLLFLGLSLLSTNAIAELSQGPPKWYCMATCKFIKQKGEVDRPSHIRGYFEEIKIDTGDYVDAPQIYDVLITKCTEYALDPESKSLYNARYAQKIADGKEEPFEDYVDTSFRTGYFKVYNSVDEIFVLGESCLADRIGE